MHLNAFQKQIDYQFKNRALLEEALTHPSLAHENGANGADNQRLEFLGDAILQLVLTDRLYRLHPDLPEGDLTQLRAHLANRHALHRRAVAIALGDHLRLGKGEQSSGGRTRLSNLADAYEALLGAIYLDGGVRAVRRFLHREFADELRNVAQSAPRQNPKGLLQETLQARSPSNPVYRVFHESGPDHSKSFEVVVEWKGREIGRGVGASKKDAEIAAAEAALQGLDRPA